MKKLIAIAIVAALSTAVQAETLKLTCTTEQQATPLNTSVYPTAPTTVAQLLAPVDIGAEPVQDTGWDFVENCVTYKEKIWAWRAGKCKSMSPDWQSPGLGNFIKH